jgi:hypothetical protein
MTAKRAADAEAARKAALPQRYDPEEASTQVQSLDFESICFEWEL